MKQSKTVGPYAVGKLIDLFRGAVFSRQRENNAIGDTDKAK